MYGWMRRLVRSFEESSAPTHYFVACFLFWVALRLVIEAFVFRILLSPMIVVHFGMFYVSLVLWLALALALIAKRSPWKTLRVMMAGFIFVLLAPSLDYLLFHPIDYRMAYLSVGSWRELGWRYVTYFGPHEREGITPGMKIEIALVLVTSFVYVRAVSRSLLRALLALLAAWTVIFVHCAMRSILPLLGNAFGIVVVEGYEIYIESSLVLSVIAATAISALSFPAATRSVLRDARWLRALHYVLLFGMGVGFSELPRPFELDHGLRVLVVALAVLMTWVVSVMVNNVFDVEIDRINAPERPLVSGALDPHSYLMAAYWLFALTLLIAAAVNFLSAWFLAIFGIAYFVYSAPPLRLKTRCFVSKAVIGINSAAAMLAGYTLFSDLLAVPAAPLLTVLVGFSLGAHVIDLKDVEGDRAAGIRNLSTMLGQRRAQWVLGTLALLAHLAFLRLFRETWLGWAVGGLGVLQFFAITRREYRDGWVLGVQDAALACVVAYVWQM